MSIKKNLAANYAAQIYSSLIGILVLPLYLNYMGAETYGLVGFFSLLASWLVLLDLGLTPTVMRESARYRGGAVTERQYISFLRSFNLLFLMIAAAIVISVWLFSEQIAQQWLNSEDLSSDTLTYCISIMGLIIALRWACGVFRGVITGAEKLVLLSSVNSVINTLRFVVVIPVIQMNNDPEFFFNYQLLIAFVEVFTLFTISKRLSPQIPIKRDDFSFKPVSSSMRFSLSIAFTSVVWVLVTQTDKLILSSLLSLSEYGYFSLAVLAASGVLMISGPIGTALMPRLANLESKGKPFELIRLYRKITQFAAILGASVSFFVYIFAEQLLWVWTGDQDVVDKAADILGFYALGNGILVVAAFPYYLQFAKGDMKMHLYGNLMFVVVLVPLVYWATKHYSATGAAVVWLMSNLTLFFLWLPFVHSRFAKGLNARWFTLDTVLIYIVAGSIAYVCSQVLVYSEHRLLLFAQLAFVAFICFIVTCLSSSMARSHIKHKLSRDRL